MKKIMNSADNFVDESIKGLVTGFHKQIKLVEGSTRSVIKAEAGEKDKVAIVTGGGYGHIPTFMGYVGQGFVDGCAIGNIFTSPSSDVIYETAKAVDMGKGILFLFGNYVGDCLNFDMAKELLEFDGIKVDIVTVTDDIASADTSERSRRRGIAGIYFAYKAAGAMAESGGSFEEVVRVAKEANARISTMGFAFSHCTIPGGTLSTYEIKEDEMEIGMGIHGEPGVARTKIMSSKELAQLVVEKLYEDADYREGEKTAVLINSLGGTSIEELGVLCNDVKSILEIKKMKVKKYIIGRYATSMEMEGASISIFKLNDEMERLLDMPGSTPFLTV